jgi:hypothetical protein
MAYSPQFCPAYAHQEPVPNPVAGGPTTPGQWRVIPLGVCGTVGGRERGQIPVPDARERGDDMVPEWRLNTAASNPLDP